MKKLSKTSLAGYVQLAIVLMASAAVFFTETTLESAAVIALGINQLLTIFGFFKAADANGTQSTVNPDPQIPPPIKPD